MKVLYVSSNGGIHDYRFFKKLTADYEVLFLHYAANEIINEIDSLEHLRIISKKPAFKSFPLASELMHFNTVVKEFRPDLVHSGYIWQVGILAAIADFHPHLSMAWGSDILTEPDKSWVIHKLVKKVLNQSDHVQCDAEFVKKKIINDFKLPPEKITVFPWGIELGIFAKRDKQSAREKLKIDSKKFVLIYNRHLEPVYGVNYLLEAFKAFSEGKDDVMLLILSDGSMKNTVLKYITENNLEAKVRMLGRIINKELPDFLNASDVYISPALSDGTSLSLLEAMASGTGLVVTDVPAIKEWVTGDNGIMVKKENPGEIVQALEKYYHNRDMIDKHGSINTGIAKERADWDKNYLKLKEIYNKLLKQ